MARVRARARVRDRDRDNYPFKGIPLVTYFFQKVSTF